MSIFPIQTEGTIRVSVGGERVHKSGVLRKTVRERSTVIVRELEKPEVLTLDLCEEKKYSIDQTP